MTHTSESEYEDSESEQQLHIMMDVGSETVTVGSVEDMLEYQSTQPRYIFPSIVGTEKPPQNACLGNFWRPHEYVGDEVLAKRAILNCNWPIKQRKVCDWNKWEKIIHHTFYNEYRIDSSDIDCESYILLSESIPGSQNDAEKKCQIMFESFNVPFYCSINEHVCSLHSYSLNNGIVLDIGSDSIYCVGIENGHIINESIKYLNYGGRNITAYFHKLLCDKGYELSGIFANYHIEDMKKRLCFYAEYDYDTEVKYLSIKQDSI
eukprot:450444_1